MNLRFFSGSVTPSRPPRKSALGVDVHQRDVVAVAEQAHDLLGLARAHQAVIDEHAGQLLADRLVDQHRRDGAVDAARKAADHPALADLLADVGDLGVAEARHRPVAGAAADVPDEIGEQLAAVGRVHHLRVEHQAVALRVLVGGDGEGRAFGRGDDLEAGRERLDPVAVAHPHLVLLADVPQAVEQRARCDDLDEGAAELALIGGDHLAAELLVKRLLAVADAEERQAAVEQDLRRARALRLDHRGRAAGEDDALRLQPVERLLGRVERRDLANRRRPRACAGRSAA